MTSLWTRLGRFGAPVDYGDVRPWLQRVRAFAAGVIAIVCWAGVAFGLEGAWLPGAAATIVVVHALTRGRGPHRPIEPLVIDSIAIAFGVGIAEAAHVPLVAALAYLIAVAITFGGLGSLVITLGSLTAAILARGIVPLPDAQPSAGTDAVVWFATAVFLGGVVLALTSAAQAVQAAHAKQGEALDVQRKAAEMKNQFVSMVTHELRTPLTNIAGFADTLIETWKELPEDDIQEFLGIIVDESEHLKNLVEDVLAIPRLEAGRLLLETTDFQLRPAAFKVAKLLFLEGGDRQASVSIGGNVIVHADPNRVEQVLRNLLENARKYGGDQVNIEAIPQGPEWQIVVSDTGPGLPLEDRERVFGAFEQVTGGETRTESGFGLGLAVAKNLVEAMGGRIWYEPGFPVGARFCFTLPAATEGSRTADKVA